MGTVTSTSVVEYITQGETSYQKKIRLDRAQVLKREAQEYFEAMRVQKEEDTKKQREWIKKHEEERNIYVEEQKERREKYEKYMEDHKDAIEAGKKYMEEQTRNKEIKDKRKVRIKEALALPYVSNIIITDEIVQTIQTLFKDIFYHTSSNSSLQEDDDSNKNMGRCDDIQFYSCQHGHRVFSLTIAPNLIFKTCAIDSNASNEIMKRYEKTCSAHKLVQNSKKDLLVVPHVALFTIAVDGKNHYVIAEERLNIQYDDSIQEQYYNDHSDSLEKAVRQLTGFIIDFDASDVEFRNFPTIENVLDSDGNRMIALIDLEDTEGWQTGIFGGGNQTGLVNMVSAELCKIIESELEEEACQRLCDSDYFKTRLEAIENNSRYKEHLIKTNIVRSDEPFMADEQLEQFISTIEHDYNIDLDLDRVVLYCGKGEGYTMRMAIKYTVGAINRYILNSSKAVSMRRRQILLSIHANSIHPYTQFKISEIKHCQNPQRTQDKEYDESINWLQFIIQHLVSHKYIYSLDKVNGHGYYLRI